MGAAEHNGRVAVLRAGLSEYLSGQVLDLIRKENLRRGDRLPSVRLLAERYSVAGPTMREALRRLQANGVVELRHGSGVYVRNGKERMVLANPSHDGLEARTVGDLLDARLLIEPHLTELTTRKASDAEVAELGCMLEEAEQYLSGNDKMLHRTNMGFHRAIAGFSGNSILAQTIESLIELYSLEQLAILSFYNDRPGDHKEHLEIFAAIRDRDAMRAGELMRRHILGIKSVVEGRISESTSDGTKFTLSSFVDVDGLGKE